MGAPAIESEAPRTASPLERGVNALCRMQREDGSWEGECVWNSMLAAQYAITAHVIRLDVSESRRRGLLTQFRATRNDQGLWGLHPYDEGSLFVTTLVYVAARLLGASPEAPWLLQARAMFEREGVERIPTWGKAWLALLGLYEWRGIHPMLPEIWALPSKLPVHPANYYCHTRSIYMGLAVLYGERFVAPREPTIDAIRSELYNDRYDSIDFASFASKVREADAPFQPSPALKAVFATTRLYERIAHQPLRRRILRGLRARMRRHLRQSGYLGLSPVNGLLSILSLWIEDPSDPDLLRAIDKLDAWFWEDADEGARVAGAGSVCWDTAFAMQALTEAGNATRPESLTRGARYLSGQQISESSFDPHAEFRIDPTGGWCFSERAHGWPVSDCTAEALIALLRARPEALGREEAARAARFVLRCQNPDGGFGSYEPRKTSFPLEWMNPAEMFGNCVTERSYVECTASSMMALTEVRERYPDLLRPQLESALAHGGAFLTKSQRADGAWNAAWGVHFLYATMFGVRGLLAAGVPSSDARVRRACQWIVDHQHADGGWGEEHLSASVGHYVEARAPSPVQTAWAMIALLEAADPNANAISRGASFLSSAQLDSGQWPDGEYVGVFFETALLNYRLYRQYFPVMALALHHRALTGARTEVP